MRNSRRGLMRDRIDLIQPLRKLRRIVDRVPLRDGARQVVVHLDASVEHHRILDAADLTLDVVKLARQLLQDRLIDLGGATAHHVHKLLPVLCHFGGRHPTTGGRGRDVKAQPTPLALWRVCGGGSYLRQQSLLVDKRLLQATRVLLVAVISTFKRFELMLPVTLRFAAAQGLALAAA